MASQTRLLHDVIQKQVNDEHYEMPNHLDTVIIFRLCEQIGVTWIETPTPVIYGEPKLVANKAFRVLLSDAKRLCHRRWYTEAMAKELSRLGVEEHLQASIIEKIFQVIEVAVPGLHIEVSLTLVSSIEALEQVRLDSLETTVRETWSCVICLEDPDHYGAVEDGTDHQSLIITRLPCSHLYHRNCIIQWLEKSPSCPYCRYLINAGRGSCR